MCVLKSNQQVKWSKEQLHCSPNGSRQTYALLFCGVCGFETTSNVSLNLHIKEKHLVSTMALQPSTTNKEKYKFPCLLCPFKAQSKRAFEQHNTCHRNQAKYQCPVCSYSVDNLGNLNRHLGIHSEENGEDNNTIGEHQVIILLFNQKDYLYIAMFFY